MIPAHQNPTATLRAIYQRLIHLKKQHPETYQYYKDIIIDRGIPFLPLYAMGPIYPAIDAAEYSIYLVEAIRFKNTGLVQHILLQMFSDESEFSAEGRRELWGLSDWIFEIAAEMAIKTTKKSSKEEATSVDHQALLRRIRPHLDRVRGKVADSILFDQRISPSDQQATEDLNRFIGVGWFSVAIKMLQRGVVPNEQSIVYFSQGNFNGDLFFEFIKFVPQYPQLLNVLSMGHLLASKKDILLKKADVELIEAIYKSAEQFPLIYDSHCLAIIRWCLLESAVIRGNLSVLQAYEKNTKESIATDVICFAIEHDQLAILQHFMRQVDKNTLICSRRIANTIIDCPHLRIVKYLVEEVKLLERESNLAGYLVEIWQSIKHQKRNFVTQCLSELKQDWLGHTVMHSRRIDVFDYLISQAPEHCRLTPTGETLQLAIDFNQEAAARYLIERCGIQPNKKQLYGLHHYPRRNPGLAVYLLGRFLDDSEALVSRYIQWNLISQKQKPNDTTNKALDWLMGPEGKKQGINQDDLESKLILRADDFQSYNVGIPMLAWLAAKLKIKISKASLEARAHAAIGHCIGEMGSSYISTSCVQSWKKMYLEAFDFYYQKYQQDLRSVEASSSAVILRAVTKDNAVEEKSHALSQASSAFSFDVDELPSQPETTVEVLEAARMHYRR
jgi:hypothetical protein